MRTAARFPSVADDAGHYESFYMKASDPAGGRAVWIRHTVHKRPGSEPTCAVWMTYFDVAGPPRAAKQQFGAPELSVPAGAYVSVAGSEIGPGRVRGSVEAGGTGAAWDLTFADRHDALRHLPAEWMYRAPLPRTKLLSPHPGAVFDGALEIGPDRIEIAGWPGMVGHNWGAEHAERWIWIHAADPEGGYLDIAAGRVRIGPATTPWIANGRLALDGAEHRLGGIGRSLRSSIDAGSTGCRLSLGGDGVSLTGSVSAPPERFVAWVYSDPAGGSHHALNCSVADLDVRIERDGGSPRNLTVERGAVYEYGSRETDHGVPVQPFPDG